MNSREKNRRISRGYMFHQSAEFKPSLICDASETSLDGNGMLVAFKSNRNHDFKAVVKKRGFVRLY
jgi:hypothetical protein